MNSKRNRYYLMRHGESFANRRGLIVSHQENALNDYGLTTLGAEQVMQAALSTRLDQTTRIISSDYLRAKETAEIMHSVLSCTTNIEYDTRLRERDFGNWELQDHANYEAVWSDDIQQPGRSEHNVECVEQVLERTNCVLNDLETRFQNERILLVGHGDVLQILLASQHHINPRFHRSLSLIANADIRSLAKLELAKNSPAA